MNNLRRYLRQVLGMFDIPRTPKTPPKPKSPLRVQFETEWSEAVNSAGRTLNLAALGIVSGVMLTLTAMLCFGEKCHAALATQAKEKPCTQDAFTADFQCGKSSPLSAGSSRAD